MDASGIKSDFIITVTREDWKKIVKKVKKEEGQVSYEATSVYPIVLSPYFNKVNHICCLVGEKKTLTYPQPKDSTAAFYIARLKCKAPKCSGRYVFTVQKRPKSKSENIDIHVK